MSETKTITREDSFLDMFFGLDEPKAVVVETEELDFDTLFQPIVLHEAVKSENKIVRGQNHHCSKLTEDDVLGIFNLKSLGLKQKEIAQLYDISNSNVHCILNRVTWKHLQITE